MKLGIGTGIVYCVPHPGGGEVVELSLLQVGLGLHNGRTAEPMSMDSLATEKVEAERLLKENMELAIAEAIAVLNLINNEDEITTGELESAADALRKIVESVVSGGLARSDPLIAEATKVDELLREMVAKIMVSAVDVISIFQCMY